VAAAPEDRPRSDRLALPARRLEREVGGQPGRAAVGAPVHEDVALDVALVAVGDQDRPVVARRDARREGLRRRVQTLDGPPRPPEVRRAACEDELLPRAIAPRLPDGEESATRL